MNVNCIICSDLLGPTNEVYATRCGHVFHQTCLLQWIERSKTCPQCRTKTTDKTIFRIYFNFLNTDGMTLDAGSLQVKLDNVEFQLKQSELKLSKEQAANQCLQLLFHKTEETFLSAKEKMKTQDVAIKGLQDQILYLRRECDETSKLRQEKLDLEKNLALLKGLEEVIYGTASEVEEMVKCQTDITAMCTYIIALKRASADLHNKKKRLAESVRSQNNQLSKANIEKMDQQAKMKTLEESLAHTEDEIKQLKREMTELKAQLQSSCSRTSVNKESSPNENLKRKYNISDDLDLTLSIPKSSKTSNVQTEGDERLVMKTFLNSQRLGVEAAAESNSPYLKLKQSNPLGSYRMKMPGSSLDKISQFTIFKTYKSLENTDDIFKEMRQKSRTLETAYDGFGGHSRLDVFPVAKKPFTSPTKRHVISKDRMKGLVRPANQSTIDSLLKKFTEK